MLKAILSVTYVIYETRQFKVLRFIRNIIIIKCSFDKKTVERYMCIFENKQGKFSLREEEKKRKRCL